MVVGRSGCRGSSYCYGGNRYGGRFSCACERMVVVVVELEIEAFFKWHYKRNNGTTDCVPTTATSMYCDVAHNAQPTSPPPPPPLHLSCHLSCTVNMCVGACSALCLISGWGPVQAQAIFCISDLMASTTLIPNHNHILIVVFEPIV